MNTNKNNGYFHTADPTVKVVGGMELLPSWWSRPFEYAWAMQFAERGQIVADMGCGWSGRPFKEQLAQMGCEVYAIDADPRVLDLPAHKDVHLVVRNFLEPMDDLPQFDRIFCLSVLEDLTKDLWDVLKKFAKKLKPDGLLVVTFDTPYDTALPTPKYPGMNLIQFFDAYPKAGLQLVGQVTTENYADLVHHQEWNLACVHFVLRLKNE